MRHIYKLTNTANQRPYFGETSTTRLVTLGERAAFAGYVKRHAEHIGAMERGDHYNDGIQADYDNGQTSWTFEIIQTLKDGATKAEALAAEKAWVLATPSCYNIKHKHGYRTGGKLTEAEVTEIKAYGAMGYTGKQIAKFTGRSTASVSLVLNNKRDEVVRTRQAVSAVRIADLVKQVIANPVLYGGKLNVRGSLAALGCYDSEALAGVGAAISPLRDAINARLKETV